MAKAKPQQIWLYINGYRVDQQMESDRAVAMATRLVARGYSITIEPAPTQRKPQK